MFMTNECNMEKYVEKQLNESYNGKLTELFKEWKASYGSDKQHLFVEDGLVVKYKDESTGYDINEQWQKSPRKIAFLLKDCPDDWGYDARRLLVGYGGNEKSQRLAANVRNIKGRFFHNLARMLYGLSAMTDDYKGVELANEMTNIGKLREAFNEIPFAYIECKKLAGGKTCANVALNSAMSRDNEFLAKEIEILKPNIIVCCGGEVFDNVVANYFKGVIPEEDCRWDYVFDDNGEKGDFRCKMYYYKEHGVLLFDSYHPSARVSWRMTEKVFSPLREFFGKYKTFDVVSGSRGL